jgi:hypothetical protein
MQGEYQINLEEIVSSSDLTDMRKINPNIHIVKIQIPYTPKEQEVEMPSDDELDALLKKLKEEFTGGE